MCGIVGIIPNIKEKDGHRLSSLAWDLLLLNTLRGSDGVGCFWYEKSKNAPQFVKKGMDAPRFLMDKVCPQAVSGILSNHFWVGHNRAATVGKLSDENSHPFVFDHIIGVHNGTLRGTSKLSNKYFPVDSMAIFDSLSKNENIETTIKNIRGAAALVWFNSKTNTLNFWRNEERPLSFVELEGGTIIFASEAWMATNLASRNGFKVVSVFHLEENKLCSYNINTKDWAAEVEMKQDKEEPTYWNDFYDQIPRIPRKNSVVSNVNTTLTVPEPFRKYLTDPKEHTYETISEVPMEFYGQGNNIKVGDHVFFCITRDTKMTAGGSFRNVIGELHDTDEVVISGVMHEDAVKSTYNRKTMLFGRVLTVKQEGLLSNIYITNIHTTNIIDPLWAAGFPAVGAC